MARVKQTVGRFDSPYQRIALLVVGILVGIGVIFAINVVVQALNSKEKGLVEAIARTLKEPRINGDFSLSQQAQANTFDAKGTFAVDKLSTVSAKADVNASINNEKVTVPVEVYGDVPGATTYIKASNAVKVGEILSTNVPAIQSDVMSIANKIDGKWLRIASQKKDDSTSKCTAALFEKIKNDPSATSALTSAYAGNRFLSVEDVQQDNNQQLYTAKYDPTKLGGFIKELKTKDFFKSIKDCSENYDPLGTEAAAAQTTSQQQTAAQQAQNVLTAKITVQDGKLLDISSVSSANNQVNTMKLTFNYKAGPAPVRPTENIVDYSQLQTELSSLGQMIQQAASTSTQSQQMTQ